MKNIRDYLDHNLDDIFDYNTLSKMFNFEELNVSKKEILYLIYDHNKIAISRKNELLKRKSESLKKISESIGEEKFSKEEKENNVNSELKTTINFSSFAKTYGDLVVSNDNLDDIFEMIKSEVNYSSMLPSLLLYLCGELVALKELDEKEAEVLSNKIATLKDMISIDKAMSEDNEKENINVQAISLYRSLSGNIAIYSDLKSIDSAFYDQFKALLESIQSGKYLNYKAFSSNSTLKGVKEVKLGQCRVAFVVSDGICYILNCFVKKSNSDFICYTELIARNKLFRKFKNYITSMSNSEIDKYELNNILEYLEENKRMVL